jgi:hypothetical protein
MSIAPMATCELHPVRRTDARSHDDVRMSGAFVLEHQVLPGLPRICRIVGHDELCHQQTARRSHERGRQEVLELDTELRVGSEHRAGHRCHARRHHREDLRLRQPAQVGTYGKRRFSLPDEYRGSRAQRLDRTRADDPAKRAPDDLHDPLHDPEVIEDAHQRGEEDDDRQDVYGKTDSPGSYRREGPNTILMPACEYPMTASTPCEMARTARRPAGT